MGGSISVLSKERYGSIFSFKLPLRTVQQGPISSVSNDETGRLRDGDNEDVTYTDVPGSLQFSSPGNLAYVPPRPQTRRRKVNCLPAFHTRLDQRSPATEFLSQTTMEPSSTDETMSRVQCEGYVLCPRPNSFAHLDTQDALLRAAPFQYARGFEKEDPVKSHHRSNSSTDRRHRGRVRKSIRRSSPVQGNTRKMGKAQISERMAAREPLPAAKVVKYSRPFRILVAEDDPVNIKVATQMMIALGHELKVVNNGSEAIQAVQQGTYDVVLMVSNYLMQLKHSSL